MKLRLVAPAKINWTLEVLRHRDDGYHDICSLIQTLTLHDVITISPSVRLDVRRTGLNTGPVSQELVLRAAEALRQDAGRPDLAALIELEKTIPVAAGLGGGSSDAAATLRGLNRFWDLGLGESRLAQIGTALGSDVPFFLTGGTAVVSDRGEQVEPRPDIPPVPITLAVPADHVSQKTAHMYGALRPEHFTSGQHTRRLLERLKTGQRIRDSDVFNAFEWVLSDVMPIGAKLKRQCESIGERPHLAGAGPALFFLAPSNLETKQCLRSHYATLIATATSTRQESITWEELR